MCGTASKSLQRLGLLPVSREMAAAATALPVLLPTRSIPSSSTAKLEWTPKRNLEVPNPPPPDVVLPKSTLKQVRHNIWRMVVTFPYWDMAFWSGWTYSWGSVSNFFLLREFSKTNDDL